MNSSNRLWRALAAGLRATLNKPNRAQSAAQPPTGTAQPSPFGVPGPPGWQRIRPVPIAEVLARISYSPQADGRPQPGEVVWAWVPWEEDPSRGKDRPILIMGSKGDGFYALQLTSKDHDSRHAEERARGEYWFDLGSGPWDSKGRPSEVKLHRPLWFPAAGIRREGSYLDRARFDRVVAALCEAGRDH
ncbi:type II toxin-antitoxin system PemK/MazF family toxin [Scrofimicrobium sp. R131]|uniref:Growth inhibitor PemK n=1 Tax=Scrofimicrobium appendicitidis TaxID=3079930 RepID=A0AAU7V4B6_9ACTO